MDSALRIDLVRDEQALVAILDLQRENHRSQVSAEEARTQGFVTVTHSLDLLRAMHALAPSVIATQNGELVGYALMMPCEARPWVPLLAPMFEMLDGLCWRGSPLMQLRYYVMGQICVARSARGAGVFDALYAGHRTHYGEAFDCVVTEVATRNLRSMRAHRRVGFELIHQYRDEIDEWAVLGWGFGA